MGTAVYTQQNDQTLINYSYRPAGDNSVPTLSDGTQLTLVQTVTSIDPAHSISVEILQDSVGNFYVTSRGTNNLQNVVTDLRLANDPLSPESLTTRFQLCRL